MRQRTKKAVLSSAALLVVMTGVSAAQPAMTTPSTEQAESRIIGGTPADFPFAVSLQFAHKGNPDYDFCGGALLPGGRHVLTAAHCFMLPGHPKPEAVHVRAGHPDKHQGEFAKVVGARIADFHQAPPGVNDIAVLTLDRRLRARPTWIAPSAGEFGATVRAIGWGRTDEAGQGDGSQILHQVDLIRTTRAACSVGSIDDRELCLAPRSGQNAGVCYGDSGSPGLRKVAGRWMVVGVASRGARTNGRCGGGAPDIFTDATARQHRDFVVRAVLDRPHTAAVSDADVARLAEAS
ncbi:trypsin-like serine protease [Allokutzneria sp. NRRL B-24872]|uniref:S1 family peptidase n=1 Tax=Allokutzneria sp. NRRL B-24872 TaxID=1137961 RepID=UPI001177A70B|nr:serine protease [Allokutzneria sp. NRRL B-24872]